MHRCHSHVIMFTSFSTMTLHHLCIERHILNFVAAAVRRRHFALQDHPLRDHKPRGSRVHSFPQVLHLLVRHRVHLHELAVLLLPGDGPSPRVSPLLIRIVVLHQSNAGFSSCHVPVCPSLETLEASYLPCCSLPFSCVSPYRCPCCHVALSSLCLPFLRLCRSNPLFATGRSRTRRSHGKPLRLRPSQPSPYHDSLPLHHTWTVIFMSSSTSTRVLSVSVFLRKIVFQALFLCQVSSAHTASWLPTRLTSLALWQFQRAST